MKLIIFVLLFMALIFTASAQDFEINPSTKDIEITFSSPKGDNGWSNPYTQDFDVVVTNKLNDTVIIRVSTSSNYYSYIGLTSSVSSLTIPPMGQEKITITVKVADSAGDGITYSENIKFTMGYETQNLNIHIRTKWPPPTLSLSGSNNFGEIEAGEYYSGTFTIKELLNFNIARNVNIKLNEAGPIHDIGVNPSTFSYIDTVGGTVIVNFKVNENGLTPGTYHPYISISSTNDAELFNSYLEYSIPIPIVDISKSETDLFFEYGETEKKNQRFDIIERGGKTPLENTIISFARLNREFEGKKEEYKSANWFSFPTNIDFISQGMSRTIDIEISKPEEAPTGKYTWEGNLKTKYSGEKPLIFNFIIRPPDVNKLLDNLTNFENTLLVRNYPEAANLIETSKSLLNKDTLVMKDISNVISLANVVITYFNSLNIAYEYIQEGGDQYDEAYEEFRKSNMEIQKFDNIRLIKEYGSESYEIQDSAKYVMKEIAGKLLGGLEENANRLSNPTNSGASYSGAKEAYEKNRNICSWMNDINCMQAYEIKVNEINDKINVLILKANDIEKESGKIHEEIYFNTWNILSINLVKNPLKFQYFFEKYMKLIENYNEIIGFYKLSGDNQNLEKSREKLSALESEYESFKYLNGLYIFILGSILFAAILKSIKGLINFGADAKDVRLNEVGRLKRII